MNLGLYTDLYELNMAQGYFYLGKFDDVAVFDYFLRKNPFKGSYTIFVGLQTFLEALRCFSFSSSDLEYLEKHGFKKEFLDYLEKFKFNGTIYSVREGEVVFDNEVLMRVEGNLIETQILESLLLNYMNFQSLIATKAKRIVYVSEGKPVVDFGLRRAQGKASLLASRAMYISGVVATSNVLAGKLYNIPISGTQAHSWIQSFNTEYEAFKAYADMYPDNCILLIDTYDILNSGLPNAIKVAKYLEEKGYKLKAVRIDSGDLVYYSKEVRKILDENGLSYVQIIASNQLDEEVITHLHIQGAKIDAYGVGTRMITAYNQPALDGVYKLVEINGRPTLKISSNIEKITVPGKKELYRYYDDDYKFAIDVMTLSNEDIDDVTIAYHPSTRLKNTDLSKLFKREKLLAEVYPDNKHRYTLNDIRDYCSERFSLLTDDYKRLLNPRVYRVGVSNKLFKLRASLIEQFSV